MPGPAFATLPLASPAAHTLAVQTAGSEPAPVVEPRRRVTRTVAAGGWAVGSLVVFWLVLQFVLRFVHGSEVGFLRMLLDGPPALLLPAYALWSASRFTDADVSKTWVGSRVTVQTLVLAGLCVVAFELTSIALDQVEKVIDGGGPETSGVAMVLLAAGAAIMLLRRPEADRPARPHRFDVGDFRANALAAVVLALAHSEITGEGVSPVGYEFLHSTSYTYWVWLVTLLAISAALVAAGAAIGTYIARRRPETIGSPRTLAGWTLLAGTLVLVVPVVVDIIN
ncbi:hypothetical protein [Dactylosporangium darangshiense]